MGRTVSAIIIFIFFAAFLYGLHYGIYCLLDRQGRLCLSEIKVEGNKLLSNQAVIEASHLLPGMNIFGFNLRQVENNLKRNYLIEGAVVELFPPDKVLIKVSERAPEAVISDAAENKLICDSRGFILAKGFMPDLPVIMLDHAVPEGMTIKDVTILAILENLSGFDRKSEIGRIIVKKNEVNSIIVKILAGTVFFTGNAIPDRDLYNKILSTAAKIKARGLRIKYIDINKDSAIGYE